MYQFIIDLYILDDLPTADLYDAPVPVQEVRGDTPPGLLCRPVPGSLHLHQMFGKVLRFLGSE